MMMEIIERITEIDMLLSTTLAPAQLAPCTY